jgi:hypothetical protein
MHEFTRTLVARLGYPGHADRACQIFDVAVHRSNALASIQQEDESGDHDYGQDFDPGDGIGVDNATGSDIAIGTSSHGGGAPSTNNKTKGKAKGKPGFRWGRNAKLTAAAAIAIALREAHKADPLRDLAVSTVNLCIYVSIEILNYFSYQAHVVFLGADRGVFDKCRKSIHSDCVFA